MSDFNKAQLFVSLKILIVILLLIVGVLTITDSIKHNNNESTHEDIIINME